MLARVINAEHAALGDIDRDIVHRLITRIDLFKLRGRTGGEAAEKFGDFLGFLRIPYTEVMQEFFARRWSDHVVWTQVPHDMREYYSGDGQLFTVARLEPSAVQTPFYKNGIPSSPFGSDVNPQNGGTVRKAPAIGDDFSNFIIHQFVPEHFYIEVPNTDVANVLENGIPATDYDSPTQFYKTIESARGTLYAKLSQQRGGANKLIGHDFTLIEIDSYALTLNNDMLYTKKLHAHKQGSRQEGFYYIGSIASKALSVSKYNRTA